MPIEDRVFIIIPEAIIMHAGLSCVLKGIVLEYDEQIGDWHYNLDTTELYSLQGKRVGRVAQEFDGLSELAEGLAEWLAMKAEQRKSTRRVASR